MTLGWKRLLGWAIWATFCASSVTAQDDGAFWWLENTSQQSLKTSPTSPPPLQEIWCQCVPYYQCVDGVITTSGEGLIDIRVGVGSGDVSVPIYNVESCPALIEVCCALPNDTDSGTNPAPTTTTTLPPDTPCDCVSLFECKDPNRLVSDGQGDTSIALFNSSISHSKCKGAFQVCCAPEPTGSPLKEECVCVGAELCGENGYVITDGAGIINIRTSPTTYPLPSGECAAPGDVCCLPPPSTESPATTTPTSTAPPLPGCGWRNAGGVRVRVLGFKEGENQFGEFPWVAAILKPDRSSLTPTLQFVGGATLIHPRVVLTAAHKVFREAREELVVRLGEWDTQGNTEPYPHQDVKVSHIITHPLFDPTTLFYDVSLLFLEEEVKLQSHINTICLADDVTDVDWAGCVVNGWGVNEFGTSQYQQIMKGVTLPLVDGNTCQNNLRTTRLGRAFNLHPTFLCAGGEAGKDACKGDGGGPLSCPQISQGSQYYLLVGLTAWGVGCGREGLPGVYVNIPELKPWITASLEENLTLVSQPTDLAGGEPSGGRGRGRGREENRRRNQERREERQREREERRRQREERRNQRQEMRQERRQNRNGKK